MYSIYTMNSQLEHNAPHKGNANVSNIRILSSFLFFRCRYTRIITNL